MAISYENIHSVLNNVLLDSNIKSHTLYPQKIPCTPKLVELGYMYPQMKKAVGMLHHCACTELFSSQIII
jgi:hypothetical protein